MKFDIDKHIDYMKSGIIYKPLIINGKKYAFDIDKYFDYLRLFARLNDLKKINGGKNFYNALYYNLYNKTYKDKDYSMKIIKAYEDGASLASLSRQTGLSTYKIKRCNYY